VVVKEGKLKEQKIREEVNNITGEQRIYIRMK
jgi:hypothetical protein